MTAPLRIEQLGKVWPGSPPVEALRAVSLTVAPGQVVTLVGPNGSGKSTLLAIAAGLLHPTRGTVHLFGRPAATPEARRSLGYLPEHMPPPGRRRVREWVVLAGRLSGLDAASASQRADDIIDAMGLSAQAHHAVGRLSHGYRQCAALAQALVHDPDLVLLDEPLTGLDEPARHRVIGWLDRARDRGAAVVIATHHKELLGALSPSRAVLRDGALQVTP